MRLYGLEERLDWLVRDSRWQIEIIGEGCLWTVNVSEREWSYDLQRYMYKQVSGMTTPSFLAVIDHVFDTIGMQEDETMPAEQQNFTTEPSDGLIEQLPFDIVNQMVSLIIDVHPVVGTKVTKDWSVRDQLRTLDIHLVVRWMLC